MFWNILFSTVGWALGCPNPFRHYVPWKRPTGVLGWVLAHYFRWQNRYQLAHGGKGGFAHKGQHLSSLLNPAMPTVLVSNHIAFADPHALLEPLFDAGIQAQWLAGVEPFEAPLKCFHLTGNGSFSIDRGDYGSGRPCSTLSGCWPNTIRPWWFFQKVKPLPHPKYSAVFAWSGGFIA
ncbi:MAG: hypothetical protein U0003_04845 [Vampirovibrionales bacterium]